MKKHTLVMLLCTALSLSMLSGCAFGPFNNEQPSTEPDTAQTEPETPEAVDTVTDMVENTDTSEKSKPEKVAKAEDNPYADQIDQKYASQINGFATEAIKVYSFIDIPDAGEEDEYGYGSETTYGLYLLDNTRAALTLVYEDGDNYSSVTTYTGEYEASDSQIIFTYEGNGEDGYGSSYAFSLDSKDRITDVKYTGFDTRSAMAAGVYTCNDPDLGLLTLEVSKIGTAVLKYENGEETEGYFSTAGDRYNFYTYDEDDNLALDWYVDCSVNGTFKHTPYGETNVDYAGTYKAFGSLGELTINIDEIGKANATVNIGGQDIALSGNAYRSYNEFDDSDTEGLNVYLYAEGGYSMDLFLVDLGGADGWNYSGTYTLPLAAG